MYMHCDDCKKSMGGGKAWIINDGNTILCDECYSTRQQRFVSQKDTDKLTKAVEELIETIERVGLNITDAIREVK